MDAVFDSAVFSENVSFESVLFDATAVGRPDPQTPRGAHRRGPIALPYVMASMIAATPGSTSEVNAMSAMPVRALTWRRLHVTNRARSGARRPD
jgi:hypothetical protein